MSVDSYMNHNITTDALINTCVDSCMKLHEDDNDVILNDLWTFYFHDPYDQDWTMSSYQQICNVSSVVEYWQLHDLIKDKIINGMFFLVREYVFPCWDDENNIKGGCLSLKVAKHDMLQFWEDITIKLLSETLLKDPYRHHWNLINGISSCPKKYFTIIKIWLKSGDVSDPRMFNFPVTYKGDIIYNSNQQKIDDNHTKLFDRFSNQSANSS